MSSASRVRLNDKKLKSTGHAINCQAMNALFNRRAMIMTVAAAIFAIAIFSLVSIRVEQTREYGESMVYRVRCNEMIAFMDDVENDLERAAAITGKRSAAHAIDTIVTSGAPLEDATVSLKEMVRNGTFDGENVTYLENQSLSDWVPKINALAEARALSSNMDIGNFEIQVVPYSPWSFRVQVKVTNLLITDDYGYCSFNGTLPRAGAWLNGDVSILGLEDPLYVLETSGYVSRIMAQSNNSIGSHSDFEVMLESIDDKSYHESKDAPCFLERIEGKLGDPDNVTRHDYYVTLAYDMLTEEGLNITKSNVTIGLETFVSVPEFQSFIPPAVQPNVIKDNQSCVDHIYFGPYVGGRKVVNVTSNYHWFRIDDGNATNDHASYYNISSGALYD